MRVFQAFFDEYISHGYPTLDVRTPCIPKQMENVVVPVSGDTEDIYRAITFFSIMGIDVKTIDLSLDTLWPIVGQATQYYVGVIAGKFGFFNGSEVGEGSDGQYRMYNLPRMGDSPITHIRGLGWKSIICETPEASAFLGFLLDRNQQYWASGTKYPETNMFFDDYALGKGKVYDIVNNLHCTIGESPEFGYGIIATGLLQQVFFNADIDVNPRPDSLSLDDLRINSIYVFNAPHTGSYSDRPRRAVFKLKSKDITNKQLLLNSNGKCVLTRSMLSTYPKFPIVPATPQEKESFRVAFRKYKERDRLHSVERYQQLLEDRARMKKLDAGIRLSYHNDDVPTQLFSASMHKFLLKLQKDNRIARTLCKINNLGYVKGVTRNITISKATQEMTYTLPNKETTMTDKYKWEKKGRQAGKYGKIIRKVLIEQVPNFKFADQELETLVNHLKACADNGEYQIVSGDDIMYWYDGERYAEDEDTGTLGCSCMRHNTHYMELYSINPDVCQMIILVKDDRLWGRALLWNNKFMDRIYGSDSTIVSFKAYAKRKGYHAKSAQNSDNRNEWIHPETGDHYQENITISVDTSCDNFPYADTFYYIDTENGYISNSYKCGNGAQLRSTDGDIYDDQRVYDDVDECYINSDDSVYIESRDINTHIDNTRYCEIECEYFLEDDMITLDTGELVSEEAHGVVWVKADDVYSLSENTFVCAHDDVCYASSCREQVYLDELDIYVMSDNVENAYEKAGYVYTDGSWIKEEDKETV